MTPLQQIATACAWPTLRHRRFSFRIGLAFECELAAVKYRIGKLHQGEQVDNGSPRPVTRRQLLDAYCDAGPAGVKAADEVRGHRP